MFEFSQRSLTRMEGIDERLVKVACRALQISRIDFGIPEYGGLRTKQEQKRLFDKDASKLDGYAKESYHQSGKALDVYAYVGGEASWDELHLTHVAAAMLQAAAEIGVPLEWGGFWPWDKPHFQIPRGK